MSSGASYYVFQLWSSRDEKPNRWNREIGYLKFVPRLLPAIRSLHLRSLYDTQATQSTRFLRKALSIITKLSNISSTWILPRQCVFSSSTLLARPPDSSFLNQLQSSDISALSALYPQAAGMMSLTFNDLQLGMYDARVIPLFSSLFLAWHWSWFFLFSDVQCRNGTTLKFWSFLVVNGVRLEGQDLGQWVPCSLSSFLHAENARSRRTKRA